MASNPAREQLIARLAESLGQSAADGIVESLTQCSSRQDVVDGVLVLLDELEEVSGKAARGAVEAMPELQRRNCLDAVVPWLDLGIALAGSSGAIALKYFKESPLLLGLLESHPSRRQALSVGLELADHDANVALECFRIAPEITKVMPAEQFSSWSDVAIELAELDFVLGIEFIRQVPALVPVVPIDLVRAWVGFGMKLITQNSLGKTDYMGTLEFFRTSPTILADIDSVDARKAVINLGSLLADRSLEAAITCLAEAAPLLRRMSPEWGQRVLQYGTLVAERDDQSAVEYLRRCPDLLILIGDAPDQQGRFEDWFKAGMEILRYSVEGARAYFALETTQALASVEQAMSGVPLRQIARSLKLFAQALCGIDVSITALPEPADVLKEPVRATVSADGRSIALPAIIRRYPTREENVRLYTVMTAHEAGHLEFGTFNVSLKQLADMIAAVRAQYGRPDGAIPVNLGEVFRLYSQPALIRDLWTILEDARVEYLLRNEYPGLSRDLTLVARNAVTTRSLLHGMSVREMVVDALLLHSTAEAGSVHVPDAISDVVAQLWPLCQTILTPQASAEETIRLAHRVYVLLEEAVHALPDSTSHEEASSAAIDQGVGPTASEETSGGYRPVTNWAYRGTLNPDGVKDRAGSETDSSVGERTVQSGAASGDGSLYGEASPERQQGSSVPQEGAGAAEGLAVGRKMPSAVEQILSVEDDRPVGTTAGDLATRAFRYHEWDAGIQDYRTNWCRVVERTATEGSSEFVEHTLLEHGATVRLLRRYFESLSPPGLRRVCGQADGDDLDMDAAVRLLADLSAGAEPSERIYVRRERRERDVAAAFLVDMSGSTSRQMETGRRVIDVEKEGLVLLCEALEAVGDQYAVYGYSGQGRHQVDFVVVKDFDEPIDDRAAHRLGGVAPLQQNRDGAAIRHATRKLLARRAKTRLLILMSDGKPLDDDYRDEYSLADTKMALREARTQGIDPFCITVDREADEYLRRMYGDVRFLVIDRVGALPERLPGVYRQLTKS